MQLEVGKIYEGKVTGITKFGAFVELAWGKNVGIESFAIDLYVIKFNIGLMVHATISQIFTIAAALIVFSKTCKGL